MSMGDLHLLFSVFRIGNRFYRPDMKMVVLHNQLMYITAIGTLFSFAVLKMDLPDVFVTTSYFHTDDRTVTERIYPIIVFVVFSLVVHVNHPFKITINVTITFVTSDSNLKKGKVQTGHEDSLS